MCCPSSAFLQEDRALAPWKEELRAVFKPLGQQAVEELIRAIWKMISLLPLMVKLEGRSLLQRWKQPLLLSHGGCGAACSIAEVQELTLPLDSVPEKVEILDTGEVFHGSTTRGLGRSKMWSDPLTLLKVRHGFCPPC
jgi:hypothetical protein